MVFSAERLEMKEQLLLAVPGALQSDTLPTMEWVWSKMWMAQHGKPTAQQTEKFLRIVPLSKELIPDFTTRFYQDWELNKPWLQVTVASLRVRFLYCIMLIEPEVYRAAVQEMAAADWTVDQARTCCAPAGSTPSADSG